MEDLYIQVDENNGGPVNHPTHYWNLKLIFGDFDSENPPKPFEKFIRKPINIGPWQIHERTEYERNLDGIYTDVHVIRNMTPEEKESHMAAINVYIDSHLKGWKISDDGKQWVPPVPWPSDVKTRYYVWNNKTQRFNKRKVPKDKTTLEYKVWENYVNGS